MNDTPDRPVPYLPADPPAPDRPAAADPTPGGGQPHTHTPHRATHPDGTWAGWACHGCPLVRPPGAPPPYWTTP